VGLQNEWNNHTIGNAMKLLIVLDGKMYEIEDVASYSVLSGMYRDYETVIEISTTALEPSLKVAPEASGEEIPLQDKGVAEGVRTPSEKGITLPTVTKQPLSDVLTPDVIKSIRDTRGVKFGALPLKGKLVGSAIHVKTRSIKVDSPDPVMSCMRELAAAERIIMKNDKQVLVIVQPPELRMRKDTMYVQEQVEVYELESESTS